MLKTATPLAAALLVSSCVISIPTSELQFDGVDLEEHHEEELQIQSWHPDGLIVDANIGDVRIEPTSGPTTIIATLHETELGDARLVYEDGELKTETQSGEPSAIGDLLILANGPIPSARVASGMGTVHVQGVRIDRDLKLEAGMGDIVLEGVRAGGKVTFSTGMGDISASDLGCDRVNAESGLGDIELAHVEAGEADVDSGLGDIEVKNCTFDRLDADTGLGDIDCIASSYKRGSLDTGLGSVND